MCANIKYRTYKQLYIIEHNEKALFMTRCTMHTTFSVLYIYMHRHCLVYCTCYFLMFIIAPLNCFRIYKLFPICIQAQVCYTTAILFHSTRIKIWITRHLAQTLFFVLLHKRCRIKCLICMRIR